MIWKKFLDILIPKRLKEIILSIDIAVKFQHRYKAYKDKKKSSSIIRIIFLVQRTEVWNSFDSVYKEALKRNNIEVYLVALPKYKNGKFLVDNNDVFEFCKTIIGNNNIIRAYNVHVNSFYNLEKLKPNYIFIRQSAIVNINICV